MDQESQEKALFEKYLLRSSKILGLTGMNIKEEDSDRTMLQRLRHRPFYCISIIVLLIAIVAALAWAAEAISLGKVLTEITYVIPCVTFCVMGNLKAYFFVKSLNFVNEVIHNLRLLQNMSYDVRKYRDEVEDNLITGLWFYDLFTLLLSLATLLIVVLFALGPLITMTVYYSLYNEMYYLKPFPMWYPIREDNLVSWLCLFPHQVWAAHVAVFSVLGPDFFFGTTTLFINTQFHCLQYDIERIHFDGKEVDKIHRHENFRAQFDNMIKRHNILIRCVTLLELIFTKATLFNVASSSVIICITGFNVMAIESKLSMMPFIAFLLTALLQIVLLCYSGDKIMENSTKISEAAYNNRWYEADAAIMKDLLFLSLRSQKACKITAYDFTDISLNTLCRILGRAWSYFALLQTMYSKKS